VWTGLIWLRIEYSGWILRKVNENVGNFLRSCVTGGFSRRAQLHEVSIVVVNTNRGFRGRKTNHACTLKKSIFREGIIILRGMSILFLLLVGWD
jgi:hypothetical protein